MSEESVSTLQEIVAHYRKNYPGLIDKKYEEMYRLKDNVAIKKEETWEPKQLPNLNWPENLGWKTAERVADEKVLGKIKEQMKLMALLQKEERNPISKILSSIYKK